MAFGGSFSQGGIATPSSMMGGRDKNPLDQATMNVTILQMKTLNKSGNMYGVADARSVQFAFLGQVRESNPQPTCLQITLDDGTGTIYCEWFSPNQKTAESLSPGMYIRVIGAYDHDKETVKVFAIHEMQTFNEITHHILSAMHTHRSLGAAEPLQSNLFGAKEAAPAVEQTQFSHLAYANEIIAFLKANATEEGISIQNIINGINQASNAPKVKSTVGELLDTGTLYQGKDDEHFCLSE